MMPWGVWTSVSGGVTGSRSAWMKNVDGDRIEFATEAEAEAAVERYRASSTLRGGTTPSGRPIAYQYFRAAEI